jgi:hypothetical protein
MINSVVFSAVMVIIQFSEKSDDAVKAPLLTTASPS